MVEPISPTREQIGLTEDEWRDDPAAIAAWISAVEQIEPIVWAPGEREEHDRALQREFNIDAVRKQMEKPSVDDAP
ncbi:MAG TPA: hypothetical protein VHC22_29530 [Pirellulales bacterium]|nr:hypothetical protein [Pirellulales bacterium]